MPANSDEARQLQAARSTKMDTLIKVAEESGDEQAHLAAASSIIYAQDGFATQTGKQLNLTEEQEDAMMVTGQALIAAGAGSGKTRVLAGKVVDIIRREGGKSNQIIATSFSRKSSLELKDRVEKYGDPGILDAGKETFNTTHSIARSILFKKKPSYNGKEVISGGYQTQLIKIAMRQVEMTGGGEEPEIKGFFDGLFGTENETVVEDTSPSVSDLYSDSFDWQGDEAKDIGRSLQDISNRARGGFDQNFSWDIGSKLTRGFFKKWPPSAKQIKQIERLLKQYGGGRRASHFDNDLMSVVGSIWDAVNLGLKGKHKWASHDEPVVESLLYRTHVNEMTATDVQVLQKLMGLGRYARTIPKENSHNLTEKLKTAEVTRGRRFQQWKHQPAGEWFNIGSDWVDEDGRAIGTKRVGLQIGKYRANLISPSQAMAGAMPEEQRFAAAYGAYMWLKENDKDASNMIDFTDMQEHLVKLMIANPKLLAQLQKQYKWILVDEAQDLNKLQHLLFGLIAGAIDPKTQEYKSDGSMTANTFCFIGDDKQAIYEFRGATPDEFTEKSDLRDGQFDTKVITSNFRSGKQIVDAANRLIAHNSKQIPMVCSTSPERGEGEIVYSQPGDYMEAARETAEEIERYIADEGWSTDPPSFGIATRTNAEAMAFGVELIKKKIPFRSKHNFFNDPLTKGIVGWLQVAAAGNDKKAINRAVLNAHERPRFDVGRQFNKELQKKARGKNYLEWLTANWSSVYEGKDEWRNRKKVKPYVDTLNRIANSGGSALDMFEMVIKIEGLNGKSILESAVESVKKNSDQMDELWKQADGAEVTEEDIRNLAFAPLAPLMSLLEGHEDVEQALAYVEELQQVAEKQSYKDADEHGGEKDRKKEAVTIDTCHGWKGLEAIHMWVPMPEGTFPHANSGDVDSERRLAYVALTRGRDTVKVLCPKENLMGKPAGISKFVLEACIPGEAVDESQKTASSKVALDWLRTVDTEGDSTSSELDAQEFESNYGSLVLEGVV